MVYTGAKGTLLHDPSIPPLINMTKEQYETQSKSTKGTAINHFHGNFVKQVVLMFKEKLFKLKDMMKTDAGKELAEKRHVYMKEFVERFEMECQGQCQTSVNFDWQLFWSIIDNTALKIQIE